VSFIAGVRVAVSKRRRRSSEPAAAEAAGPGVVERRRSDPAAAGEPGLQSARAERVYRYTIATLWFAVTLLVALCVPDMAVVVTLLGSLAAAFMFLFPGHYRERNTHPFNGHLSGTTQVSRYQKGKTNLDETKVCRKL